ncbi:MAG: tryptophan synthase subunit alpha [Alphaproteobacteria bacterium]
MSSRISKVFKNLRLNKRSAFIPYITAGDPDIELSQMILESLPLGGADIIEIGMPFSDPMADGPSIQESSLRSLNNGHDMNKTLMMIERFRIKDKETPIVLMGYFNPILQFGVKSFINRCEEVGVDGLIVVDLPIEHSDEICIPAQKSGIDFINFITPTTNKERLKQILNVSSGFLYFVSIAGITGTKAPDNKIIEELIKNVKQNTDLPIGVGFGIKSSSQVEEISNFSDAIVVGSAIVNEIDSLKIKNFDNDLIVKNMIDFLLELSNPLKGTGVKSELV